MQQNKLIIMYIEGCNYDFSGIKTTIKSLREFYSDKIIVIYKDVNNQLLEFFEGHKVEYVNGWDFHVIFKTSPYNNKIIYIHLFLQKYKERYENFDIFYCDISDIYFRINPFEIFSDLLMFSSEDKSIGDCDTNSTWRKVCYPLLEKLDSHMVINSGLIWGNYSQMEALYSMMIEEMAIILTRINYPITDQIIVNKLIYSDKIDCFLNSKDVNNISQLIKTNIDNKINHQYKNVKQHKDFLYSKYA